MEIPRHTWEWVHDVWMMPHSLERVCSCGITYTAIPAGRYKWLGCPVGAAEKEARRKAKVARKARERAAARAAAGCYSI
jgi:hypothetical protein